MNNSMSMLAVKNYWLSDSNFAPSQINIVKDKPRSPRCQTEAIWHRQPDACHSTLNHLCTCDIYIHFVHLLMSNEYRPRGCFTDHSKCRMRSTQRYFSRLHCYLSRLVLLYYETKWGCISTYHFMCAASPE
jgi:hypothetical protein